MPDLAAVLDMSDAELETLAAQKPDEFKDLLAGVIASWEQDRKECQLSYYEPANMMAEPAHYSTAREVCLVGGNRSSKTDTMLAELAIQMTGIVPHALKARYPKSKMRGPIRARIVCNSLTDTLEPVIKPKLRWDQWNGVGLPDEGRGHWGWVPRHLLRGGKWESAYSERYRTLTVSHIDGGTSTCQFLSYDQDLTAFAGSSMHFVGHDELPPPDVYRENRMRTLDVRGQIYTAFTPPDEIGASRASVGWFYEEVYQRGRGPDKHPEIDAFVLYTEKNRILSATDIAELAARMTDEQRSVRLYGNFLHLSGVVYKLFERYGAFWCFRCQKKIIPVDGKCATCTGDDITEFTHSIQPFPVPAAWPIVYIVDPHPRKPDAMIWCAVTPSDDALVVGELEVDGTAKDVARAVRDYEQAHKLNPVRRLMDPNIATETNDKLGRGWTMRKAYDDEGLRCDLATDDVNVGIQNVMGMLTPDALTRRPRLVVFNTCHRVIKGMSMWSWSEWTRQNDREPKEIVHDRHKDFPDCVRYFVNSQPTFASLCGGTSWSHKAHGRGERGY